MSANDRIVYMEGAFDYAKLMKKHIEKVALIIGVSEYKGVSRI